MMNGWMNECVGECMDDKWMHDGHADGYMIRQYGSALTEGLFLLLRVHQLLSKEKECNKVFIYIVDLPFRVYSLDLLLLLIMKIMQQQQKKIIQTSISTVPNTGSHINR